jgi:putative transcriptional regulator
VIAVKLKEQMRAYEVRTGGRLTYEQLAGLTGLSRATIEAIASRGSYNTTLATIEKTVRGSRVPARGLADSGQRCVEPPKVSALLVPWGLASGGAG